MINLKSVLVRLEETEDLLARHDEAISKTQRAIALDSLQDESLIERIDKLEASSVAAHQANTNLLEFILNKLEDYALVDHNHVLDHSIDPEWIGTHTWSVPVGDMNSIEIGGGKAENGIYGVRLRSSNFDNTNGIHIDSEGYIVAKHIKASELMVDVLVANALRVNAGSLMASKSMAICNRDFVIPATGERATLIVQDLPGLEGFNVFEAGDLLRVKVMNRSNNGVSVIDIWMKAIERNHNAQLDQAESEQGWWVELMYPGFAVSDVMLRGSTVVDVGGAGDGYWRAITSGPFAPYSEIVELTSNQPWLGGERVRVRSGRLDGISDEILEPTGFGLWTDGIFIRDGYIANGVKFGERGLTVNDIDQWRLGDSTYIDGRNIATPSITAGQIVVGETPMNTMLAQMEAQTAAAQESADDAGSAAALAEALASQADGSATAAQSTANNAVQAAANAQSAAIAAQEAADAAGVEISGINAVIIDLGNNQNTTNTILNAITYEENNITYISPFRIHSGVITTDHLGINEYIDMNGNRMLVGSTVRLDNDGISIDGPDWPSGSDRNKVSWVSGGSNKFEIMGGTQAGSAYGALFANGGGSGSSIRIEAKNGAWGSVGATMIMSGDENNRFMISAGYGYVVKLYGSYMQFNNPYIHTHDGIKYIKVRASADQDDRYVKMISFSDLGSDGGDGGDGGNGDRITALETTTASLQNSVSTLQNMETDVTNNKEAVRTLGQAMHVAEQTIRSHDISINSLMAKAVVLQDLIAGCEARLDALES